MSSTPTVSLFLFSILTIGPIRQSLSSFLPSPMAQTLGRGAPPLRRSADTRKQGSRDERHPRRHCRRVLSSPAPMVLCRVLLFVKLLGSGSRRQPATSSSLSLVDSPVPSAGGRVDGQASGRASGSDDGVGGDGNRRRRRLRAAATRVGKGGGGRTGGSDGGGGNRRRRRC